MGSWIERNGGSLTGKKSCEEHNLARDCFSSTSRQTRPVLPLCVALLCFARPTLHFVKFAAAGRLTSNLQVLQETGKVPGFSPKLALRDASLERIAEADA